MATDPITVSIRREVDSAHIAEATAWVQTGVNLANKYPGFLGSGWVRAGERSTVWHMLYRFANEETLEAWERSPERSWWLSMGEGFVRSERSRRRTGIEGWFDEPATGSVPVIGCRGIRCGRRRPAARAAPVEAGRDDLARLLPGQPAVRLPRVPVPGWADLPIWLRALATTLVLTPIMTYWVLPFVTRMLRRWLAPAPAA